MTDLACRLAALRRPRLLIRTARFGLQDYRRTPALRRLVATAGAHSPAQIVALLLLREAEQEARRQAADAAYSVARHVELLIALMAEARMLSADAAPAPRAATAKGSDRAPQPQKDTGGPAFRLETKSCIAPRWAMSVAAG
jgi:hypothetical protein